MFQLCSNTVDITSVFYPTFQRDVTLSLTADLERPSGFQVCAHMQIPPMSLAQTHLDVSVHFAFVVQVVQTL